MMAKDIRFAAMRNLKERTRSRSEMSSDHEISSGPSDHGHIKKKTRLSRPNTSRAIIDLLQDDAQRNTDMIKVFIEGAEQDQLYQKEKWEHERVMQEKEREHQRKTQEKEIAHQRETQEKEYALRMRMIDLQFAELEERREQRQQKSKDL